ncbi:hypothetical protein UREG_05998 [Uncinocarpus reesii 1704]|uniref:Non-reducing polyketide synthase nscA n=1 Tax=Uncinocarpus reesii (strain UAMH 1704) TaxID=336963 RepID=C4JU59_UNCRE|nr:uncharacterized protein UREG_05998 [Uncinocarpus reesii 1704]EEP81156.1 hypothetical protein UREG_05998 [Uncinocarpus reesii 1704]
MSADSAANGSPQSFMSDPVMPIAIVGLAGRFPLDASNPEKLWDMIAKGRSALTDVPKDRFNIEAFYHPHNERKGTLNARGGHFMGQDVSAFDAPFFSITPNEAKAMDPQQRMALECTYEALENAGIRTEDVAGTQTSCYVGSFTGDYGNMLCCDRENLPLYSALGTGSAMLSNRISWFFDLKGPSISIDTACSSSLVALHLGCQSLRTGESHMSIVGGTNLMLMPDIMSSMSSMHFLSPDSKCHSFDACANGYSRGEGISFIILKPLDAAIQHKDMIRGVIRHTGVNQDGKTLGITVPSAKAQESMIRQLYAEAGLDLGGTQYVECHGTGTPVGDPLEALAIAETFGKARTPGDPVFIGSIKSNIGHLEGASGLAQVTNSVFALEKAEIPANPWFNKPNPRIPMDKWNLQVPTQLMPWPSEGPRRISINSFGYGGTNAHCIIDDAYHYLRDRNLNGNHNTVQDYNDHSPASSNDSGVEVKQDQILSLRYGNFGVSTPRCVSFGEPDIFVNPGSKSPKLFVLTSNEPSGIDRAATVYHDYLLRRVETLQPPGVEQLFEKLAYTLASRRSILPWKSFAVASSIDELAEKLSNSLVKPIRSSKPPALCFVFTGQGAQWWAMGRELCMHQVYQQSLEEATRYLLSIGSEWSLLGELWSEQESSRIDSVVISQPICTAVQIALVDLLHYWGIKPAAVVGHSSGEIAAAYAKGAISRESAWAISYYRGQLCGKIPELAPHLKGAMLVTNIGRGDVEKYLNRPLDGNATIACINSTQCVTLSGDAESIHQLETMLKADGHLARKLKVDAAYHSSHMEVIASLYMETIANCRSLPDNNQGVKMFSSVTSKLIENTDLDPSYWVLNLVAQVNFLGAIETMCGYSSSTRARAIRPFVDILIEIGPHSALQGIVKQILNARGSKFGDIVYMSVLHRNEDARKTALNTIGRLFQHGYPVDISAANNDHTASGMDGFLVDIPPFPWNHTNRYWAEGYSSRNYRFRKHPRKDLIGAQVLEELPHEPRWTNTIRQSEVPWVEFHRVQGTNLYPAAGMVVMAIEAARQNADQSKEIEGYELREVMIRKALVIPSDDTGIETMFNFSPSQPGFEGSDTAWQKFTLLSRVDGIWETNCTGLLLMKYKTEESPIFLDENQAANKVYEHECMQIASECTISKSNNQFYKHLASIGIHYEGPFQNLLDIKKGPFKTVCALKIPDTKGFMPHQYEFDHVIHPSTLDGIFQMGLPAVTDLHEDLTIAHVPTSIARLYVSADTPVKPGSMLRGYATTEGASSSDGGLAVVVSTPQWTKPLVIIESMKSTTLKAAETAFAHAVSMRKLVSFLHWQEDVEKLSSEDLRFLFDRALGGTGNIESRLVEDLEFASFIYVRRALRAISLGEAKTFLPHLQKLYQFMQSTYERVRRDAADCQTQNANWLNTTEEFETELLARVSRGSTDGAILCAHGENLPSIMRGEVLSQEVLMKDNLLYDFYQFGVGSTQINTQLSCYLDLLAHKNSDLKILEIGAGTGGTTAPVLEILGGQNGTSPRFSNYTFTDISTGFFAKAQEKFIQWAPFMTYKRLNIEEDPLIQGFKANEYDVVIAANALHATRSMDNTLTNVKKLMKLSVPS